MKKLLLSFCCLLMSLTVIAQTNPHLKFMGIPITGNIKEFQTKLESKGCTYNKQVSAVLEDGIRAFKGAFAGNEVEIYAYYDTQTKIVYRVKAIVDGVSENIAEQTYKYYKDILSRKYGSDNMLTDTHEGKEQVSFLSLKDTSAEVDLKNRNFFDVFNGTIDLYISKDSESWVRSPYNYNVHIDYKDIHNSAEHENKMLDDI